MSLELSDLYETMPPQFRHVVRKTHPDLANLIKGFQETRVGRKRTGPFTSWKLYDFVQVSNDEEYEACHYCGAFYSGMNYHLVRYHRDLHKSSGWANDDEVSKIEERVRLTTVYAWMPKQQDCILGCGMKCSDL